MNTIIANTAAIMAVLNNGLLGLIRRQHHVYQGAAAIATSTIATNQSGILTLHAGLRSITAIPISFKLRYVTLETHNLPSAESNSSFLPPVKSQYIVSGYR